MFGCSICPLNHVKHILKLRHLPLFKNRISCVRWISTSGYSLKYSRQVDLKRTGRVGLTCLRSGKIQTDDFREVHSTHLYKAIDLQDCKNSPLRKMMASMAIFGPIEYLCIMFVTRGKFDINEFNSGLKETFNVILRSIHHRNGSVLIDDGVLIGPAIDQYHHYTKLVNQNEIDLPKYVANPVCHFIANASARLGWSKREILKIVTTSDNREPFMCIQVVITVIIYGKAEYASLILCREFDPTIRRCDGKWMVFYMKFPDKLMVWDLSK